MTLYKIYIGQKLTTMVTEDLKNEVTQDTKMWALIQHVGNSFPLYNKKKFWQINDVKCKLYEYIPYQQLRYFARIDNSRIIIYHKETKKCDSLRQKKYNEICDKFNRIRIQL